MKFPQARGTTMEITTTSWTKVPVHHLSQFCAERYQDGGVDIEFVVIHPDNQRDLPGIGFDSNGMEFTNPFTLRRIPFGISVSMTGMGEALVFVPEPIADAALRAHATLKRGQQFEKDGSTLSRHEMVMEMGADTTVIVHRQKRNRWQGEFTQ